MNTSTESSELVSNPRQELSLQWQLAIPIALTFLLNMGMSITDTVMVAGFGAHALTGIALASDSYSIIFYLGNGIVAGLAPFLAKAISRNEHKAVTQLWCTGNLIVIGLSLVLIPVLWFLPVLFVVIGVDSQSSAIGTQYQHIIAFTLFPMLVVALCRTYMTAMQNTRVILWITLSALPLNALLNFLFMHGIGDGSGLGAIGTGYSTLLVSALTAALLLWTVLRHSPELYSSLPAPLKGLNMVVPVLRTGVPIGIGSIGEVGLYLLSTVYVASVGTVDAVAHILVLRLAGVAYAVPAALSQTTTVRVSAATTSEAQRIAVQAAMQLALISTLLVCSALLVMSPSVSTLLLDGTAAGEQAAQMVAWLIVLLVLLEAFEIPALTATGVLRAHHDTRQPMIYLLFCYWFVSAPLGVFLVEIQSLGAVGIWLALLVGMMLSSVLIIVRFVGHWYTLFPAVDLMGGLKLSRHFPDQ